MQTKIIAIIAIVISFAIAFILYNTTSPEERKVLNAFHKSEMAIPDYVTVDLKQGNTYSITYGIGGQTCTSLVNIKDSKIVDEYAKECKY